MDEHIESPVGKEVKDKFNDLPQYLKDFVYSSEMTKILQVVGAKHNLHIDQIGELEAEAAAAMMGITRTEDLEENIARSLALDPQKAAAVTREVNDLLFVKVREGMKASAEPKPVVEIPKTPLAAQTPNPMPAQTPSVVMPSSIPTAPLVAATPSTTPVSAVTSAAPTTSPAKPAATPDLGAADALLSEKKVTPPPATPPSGLAVPTTSAVPAAKTDPAQPQPYKADPYREPVE